MIIIVMGVSGCGKTTVGELLAAELGCAFADADDYHSQANKNKMHAGLPLDDSDRTPWLNDLHALIFDTSCKNKNLVLACSALKETYRIMLSDYDPRVRFVYLKIDYETASSRLANRQHEFMNADLLKSQFDALEEPAAAIVADATLPPSEIVARTRTALNQSPAN